MSDTSTLFAQFKAWIDGDEDWDALHPEVQTVIDELIQEEENGSLEKAQPTMSQVSQGGQPAKRKKKRLGAKDMEDEDSMDLIQKANEEQMFTLGPWYIPNKQDAHAEWTDADELQKALWEYVKSGDRDIRLQHNKDIVAGEWVEAMSFPVPVTLNMTKANGEAKEVTYPEGTVFLGVKWNPWAWKMVKENKITGFSIGGSAARVEMGVPANAMHLGKSASLKDLARDYIISTRPSAEPKQIEAPEVTKVRIGGMLYEITPLTKVYANGVQNVAGMRGADGSVAVIRTDGRRFWASGSGALPRLPHAKAQRIFAEVEKKSFKGDRSEAGRYAANIRWWNKSMETTGTKGPHGSPQTEDGRQVANLYMSLRSHVDFDAVGNDMRAAGLNPAKDEPEYDMLRRHMSPERAALHDKIIDSHFVNEDGTAKTPVPSGKPEYLFMGGGPAAGKTTMLRSAQETGLAPKWAGNGTNKADRNPDGSVKSLGTDKHSVAIAADDIKLEFPEYKQLVNARDGKGFGTGGRKGQEQASSIVHEESSILSKQVNRRALDMGVNVVLDGTGDNKPENMRKKIGQARDKGYTVTGVYATVPTKVAIQRAKDRGRPIGEKYITADGREGTGTGRYIAPAAVAANHRSVSRTLPEIVGDFDSVSLFNTSGAKPVKILEARRGKAPKIHDKKLYDEFVGKGTESD